MEAMNKWSLLIRSGKIKDVLGEALTKTLSALENQKNFNEEMTNFLETGLWLRDLRTIDAFSPLPLPSLVSFANAESLLSPATAWKSNILQTMLDVGRTLNRRFLDKQLAQFTGENNNDRQSTFHAFCFNFNLTAPHRITSMVEDAIIMSNTLTTKALLSVWISRMKYPGADNPNNLFTVAHDLIIELALNPFADISMTTFALAVIPLLAGHYIDAGRASFHSTAKMLATFAPGYIFPRSFLPGNRTRALKTEEERVNFYLEPSTQALIDNAVDLVQMNRINAVTGEIQPIEGLRFNSPKSIEVGNAAIASGFNAFNATPVRMCFFHEALAYIGAVLYQNIKAPHTEGTKTQNNDLAQLMNNIIGTVI